jgi:tetratricopeptide (TPR) repeat protein
MGDYRTAPQELRNIVDSSHFTVGVETLQRPATGSFGADIAYTLRAFPNHSRALLAMANLAFKEKTNRPKGSDYTVDCWFARAIAFAPDDPNVRLAFGIHLIRQGQKQAALENLKLASERAPDSGNFQYNLGLAFLDAGDTESALRHAWRAKELQYTLPGLKSRLQKLGKWREPNN